jgi:hypothetical protein
MTITENARFHRVARRLLYLRDGSGGRSEGHVLEKIRLLIVLGSTGLLIGAAGCAVDSTQDEEQGAGEETTGESEDELRTLNNVPLKYEGTCDFLRSCSSYSRNLPAGNVTWGCTGVGMCSDSALWVAGPTRSYCGKTVRICNGTRCTNALVKDISVSRDWEASNGVLSALRLPYGLTGRCSGFGGGRVRISVP